MEILRPYTCFVCTEVMEKPWRIKSCSHNACYNCMYTLLNTNPSCPACRKKFVEADIEFDTETSDKINRNTETCPCGEKMTIPNLKNHVHNCNKARDVPNASVEKSKDEASVAKSFAASLSKESQSKEVVPSKYVCPVCKRANLLREELLKHVEEKHPAANAVCPICASQPWGDPNRKTHLNAHLKLRHQFSIESFTDLDVNDEDYDLKMAIELSKQELSAANKKETPKGEDSNGATKSSTHSKTARSQGNPEHNAEVKSLEEQAMNSKRVKRN